MKNLSIINDIELSTGTQIYIQVTGTRASLSVDGTEANFRIWLQPEELHELKKLVDLTIKEMEE